MYILDDFDFGNTQFNLDNILKEKKINKRKMCRELKVDYNVVNRYCRDDVRHVDIEILTKICCYLGIGYDELFTYIPPENNDEMDEYIL